MILAFDTETTGLPDWNQPSDSEHQPHLVQFAAVLLDDELVERASVNLIVKPEGWVISEEMTAIHGISHEQALRFGVSEKLVARIYADLQYGTGAEVLAVGHNVTFDLRIMRIAMLRAGFTKEGLDARKPPIFCTMRKSSPLVNMPPTAKMVKAGFTKPKPPKLGECYQHFFGEELIGAHDALIDVRGCVRVFRHLKALEAAEAPAADAPTEEEAI